MAKTKRKLPVASSPSSVEVARPYKPTKEDLERERRYKAEDALRICEQYEQNKKDKQLMSDVKSLAKEKINKLKNVAGK